MFIILIYKFNCLSDIICCKKKKFQYATQVLVTFRLLNAFSLLTHSIDRYLAVTIPLYYFQNNLKIGIYIIAIQYAIVAIIIAYAYISSILESDHMIGHFCA